MSDKGGKITQYLEGQLNIKIAALEALDTPIMESNEGKKQMEGEVMKIKHDIYELKKHIDVIKLL